MTELARLRKSLSERMNEYDPENSPGLDPGARYEMTNAERTLVMLGRYVQSLDDRFDDHQDRANRRHFEIEDDLRWIEQSVGDTRRAVRNLEHHVRDLDEECEANSRDILWAAQALESLREIRPRPSESGTGSGSR